MLEQLSNAVVFKAFYTASKIGKTGLSVTIDVYNPAGTLVITAGLVTEVGGGVYSYSLAGSNTGTEGEYVAIFKTTDSTVDFQHIPALWVVGRAGIEDLDAAVSSRSTYAGGDTSGTTTLLARLTSTRAGLLDHLDADVSSRLATSGYTTPPTAAAVMAAILDELASNHNTAGSVGKLLQNLDAAVSTRLAAAGYTAPASLASIIAGIWDELQSGHTTAGSFGKYLDAAVSSRSVYAGADTAGTTTLLARLTAGRATNLDNLDTAVSGVAAAVWAVSTRTLSSFGTLVADIWANATRSLTDKAGFALSSGGVQAVWDALTSALTTSGSVGKRIADNLDAAASSRASQTSVDALGAPLQEVNYTAPPSAATVAAAVWDRLTSALTTAGSVGKLVTDRLDVVLSTRLASSGYTAPDNTGIAAVKAKTDNLPADPADASDIAASFAALPAQVWAASGRTLTSFGTLVTDIAAAVWASVSRTLTSGAAVWDELAADRDTPGTMGALLNASGGWVNDIQNPIEIGRAAPLTFNFGPAHAGLTTVGFQLYDANGAPFGPRHTGGAVDLGNGSYQTTYTWTEAWQGSIVGDTGGLNPTYTDAASIVVSPSVAADIASVAADVGSIEARIGAGLVSAISPVLSGGRVEIVRGDDYYAADGRALVWTIPDGGWPDLTGTVSFVVDDILSVDATVDLVLGVVTVELSTDATSLLEGAEQYTWALVAALDADHRATLTKGVVLVHERIEAPA